MVDQIKARLAQLSFKAATQGLTPEEQQEMAELRKQLAMEQAKQGVNF